MPSIFPEANAGGLVIRDAAGNPTHPPGVERAYAPAPGFASSCLLTALPSDCTARIEPRQLNGVVSELTSLAECLDPNGPWDCTSSKNLCNAFTVWSGNTTSKAYVDAQDTALANSIATKVNKAGDTMSGALTLAADPTVAMQAATKKYVDDRVTAVTGGPFLPTGGGTMLGPIFMNNGNIDGPDIQFASLGHVSWNIDNYIGVLRFYNSSGTYVQIDPNTMHVHLLSPSSGPSNGALTVQGGLGVSGNINGGGNIKTGGAVQGGYVTAGASDVITRQVSISGDQAYVAFNSPAGVESWVMGKEVANADQFTLYHNNTLMLAMQTNGDTKLGSTTPSSLSTNGALVVSGGIGIGGSSTFGGYLTITKDSVGNFGAYIENKNNANNSTAALTLVNNVGGAGGTGYVFLSSSNFSQYGGAGILHLFNQGGGISFCAAGDVAGGVQSDRKLVWGAAGAYKPGGGPWGDSSDSRIKNVLGNYEHGLAEVLQLQPKLFTYKGNETAITVLPIPTEETAPYKSSPHYDAAISNTPYVGLIAQEIESIMPEMVTKDTCYINGEKVTDLRRLDTTALIFALVNSVKELTERIKLLEERSI